MNTDILVLAVVIAMIAAGTVISLTADQHTRERRDADFNRHTNQALAIVRPLPPLPKRVPGQTRIPAHRQMQRAIHPAGRGRYIAEIETYLKDQS